jgi:phosphoglycerate dehydrogenase-like enzyme
MADEPLSPDHPAWDEPRLLLTPHVARSLEQPPYRWESLFVENLRRYAAGEPLLHVVDQEAGY